MFKGNMANRVAIPIEIRICPVNQSYTLWLYYPLILEISTNTFPHAKPINIVAIAYNH